MNEKTENELYGVETDMQQPAYEEELVLMPEEETDAKGEASAEENAEAGEMEIVLGDAPKEKQEQAVRVQEEPALRAADRKVFAMSDGTQQAVFYAEPVHCFDEETQCYTEIDNAFTAEADGRYYRNAKSHFTARFSREETNDELFRIEKGAYQLVVSLQKPMARRNRCPAPVLVRSGGAEEDGAVRAAEEAPAQAPACAGPELEAAEGDLVFSPDSGETGPVAAAEAAAGTEAPENTAFKDLPEDVIPRKETLLYAGAAEHADFAYEICGDRVKENIIIRERVPVYRYGFTLSCENLSAAFLEEERTLCLCAAETGAEVFRIPAPFMTDASGVRSDGVFYEVRDLPDGTISLAVIADSAWINAPERVFPVTVDPQVIVSGASGFATYSWTCGTMSQSSTHTISACTGSGSTCASKRMYLRIALPILPRNPRIQKAELTLRQKETTGECQDLHQIGLYQVTGSIQTGACTPAYNETPIDFERIKTGAAAYTFDVTALIDAAAATGAAYANLMVKLVNENSGCTNSIIWYGSTSGSTAPQLAITYDSSYGVQTSSGTHTHALGRFGSAAIDLRRGNLMFEAEDFSFGGKRMPVTIRHLYNSALAAYQYTANGAIGLHTANFSNMNAGKGWRLSCMQSITEKSVVHEGKRYSGYVYINESGTERYLRQGDTDSLKKCCETNGQCYEYYLHTATDGSGYTYDPCKRELYMGSETYLFDTAGRLTKITDENRPNSSIDMIYTAGRLTSVIDGANRVFALSYSSAGLLTSITAPDQTHITYSYTNGCLTQITYPDGRSARIAYGADHLPAEVRLLEADGSLVYRTAYTYAAGRIASATEYGYTNGSEVMGQSTAYAYSIAGRRTVAVTTEQADGSDSAHTVKTVYHFDAQGEVRSSYVYTEDTGNVEAGESGSGIHPYAGEGGASVGSNISNLLLSHGFESLENWTGAAENSGSFSIQTQTSQGAAQFGGTFLLLRSRETEACGNGIYQTSITLPAGKYTFSAYLRPMADFTGTGTVTSPGAYLRVTKADGTILSESERLDKKERSYVRLAAPFTIAAAQTVRVGIYLDGQGTVYADGAQLENNPYVNAYNLLTNGNFERENAGWSNALFGAYTTDTKFNMTRSYRINSDIGMSQEIKQTVLVKTGAGTRETFTLSGWAKAYSLPLRTRENINPTRFRLYAVITYQDRTTEEHSADFAACTEDWQRASVQFSKEKYKAVRYITVSCEYDYNTGPAYFDDIQLVRDSIETGLTERDFPQSRDTETEESASESSSAEGTAAAETETGQDEGFQEALDAYGNALTETTYKDGEFGTIYRAFRYNAAGSGADNGGNDLVKEIDGRGYETNYTVDEETSRVQEITDRIGNKTAYEYDDAGRTVKITAKDGTDSILADISYAYDAFDNLTEISRGDGMKYTIGYNAFRNIEKIGITGSSGSTAPLVQYTYKNGNGRLKKVTYANGDTMTATYNRIGQIVAETWTRSGSTVARYQYVYDGAGNIVRSIDLTGRKEYTYYYEGGRISRAAESSITLGSGEIITARHLDNSIFYDYDGDGRLLRKRIRNAEGSEGTYTYTYGEKEDESVIAKLPTGAVSHSKTDALGRKAFDELQLGTGFLWRQFDYCTGEEAPETHMACGKLKSSPTTGLAERIRYASGRTIAYTYDAEERITHILDSEDGETHYTYDALGQLIQEIRDGETVIYAYDAYGNLLKKGVCDESGVLDPNRTDTYGYGNSVWKDQLCTYNGKTISYDASGNPLSYRDYTCTWEKGRQLKQAVNEAAGKHISYTYNANGIRTSKTVNGIKHSYVLDGTKILRETYGSAELEYLYDNEEEICGLRYNGTPYYFYKNLQGDIIAITDGNGTVQARYTYHAWGVCRIVSDETAAGIAEINPFRYRSYYYDAETGWYYLQSRYYDPEVGRFLNSDDPMLLGANGTVLGYNLFAYCENNSVNMMDSAGLAAINVIFAAVGAVVGWLLGDFVAKRIGYYSGWKYWAIRAGVVVGSAVIGWFAGSLMAKIIATYLKRNPAVVFKITNKLGATGFHSAMKLLGINPFSLAMDSSKFIAIARLFNTKAITIGYDWAVKLYYKAKALGFRISLDSPHSGYTWHIHISGANGKLVNLHIQIAKKAWDYLVKLLK